MSESSEKCTTVYFDGSCPMCQREIAVYKTKADADSIRFVDAASCDASLLGKNLDRDAALARLHVRRSDGSLASGAAAFSEIWTAVPGFRWLGRFAKVPPVAFVLEHVYRVSLKIRPRLQHFFHS